MRKVLITVLVALLIAVVPFQSLIPSGISSVMPQALQETRVWADDAQTGTTTQSTSASTSDNNMDYLKTLLEMIKDQYGGTVTDEQLIQGAVKGIFDTMDPYTTYLGTEDAGSFMDTVGGSYKGLGITLEKSGDYVAIVEVFEGSPAEKAGLLPGDRIAAVNGENVAGKTAEEVKSKITDAKSDVVKLDILHFGKSTSVAYSVTRDAIKINPIRYEIRNGIGYINISTFNGNVTEYLKKALDTFDSSNVKQIVLDLRNDPGGEVDQAVNTAMDFVPKGLITTLDFKSDKYQDQEYSSTLDTVKYKLVVLVNEMSASASEIVAGAIQDRGSGLLIGTTTYGKGKVQTLVPLLTPEAYSRYEAQYNVKLVDAYDLTYYGIVPQDSDIIGWAKITTGVYLTPNGRMIDGTGLQPDIAVADPQPVNGILVTSIRRLTVTNKTGLNGSNPDVYNAEKILKLAGYNVDDPDYILDAKTFNAIKKFQADNKLYPYGVLDLTTQKRMNDKLLGLIMKYDAQYAKAVETLSK